MDLASRQGRSGYDTLFAVMQVICKQVKHCCTSYGTGNIRFLHSWTTNRDQSLHIKNATTEEFTNGKQVLYAKMPHGFACTNRINKMNMGANQTGRMWAGKIMNFQTVEIVRWHRGFATTTKVHLSARKCLHDSETCQQIGITPLHSKRGINRQRITIHRVYKNGMRHTINCRNFAEWSGTEGCP